MTLYKDEKVVHKEPIEYVPKRDAAITTDNEVVLSGFDCNYSWNPWDYRRKALQEAKLKGMATKAVQCTSTYLQTAIRVQTDHKITKETQSKRITYSNTPTPLTYIRGLRGRKDSKQEVLNMTYYDFPKKCYKTDLKGHSTSNGEQERFFKNVWELLEKGSFHHTTSTTNFARLVKELEDVISNDDGDNRMRMSFFSL
nr:unnamed protein product [Callosobruchus chinensis]